MNKRNARVIFVAFTVLIVASLACTQNVAGFQIGPTATPTVTNTPLPTATPQPTLTPSPVPTPTMSTGEICKSKQSDDYVHRSNAIWGIFMAIDQAVGKNIGKDGRIKSTEGFADFSKAVSDLANEQAALDPPSIFLAYNEQMVEALGSYKVFLDDAVGSKSLTVLQIDAIQAVDDMKAANREWLKIGEVCGWPSPVPPASG